MSRRRGRAEVRDVGTPPARRRRRTVGWVLLTVLLVGGVVGGRMLLLKSDWFRVEQVQVRGPADIDQALVRTSAGIRAGQPLLSVDADAVRRSVSMIGPVATVAVSRQWPHTVVLNVTERTPVALTPSANGPWLVDGTGLAYRPAPTPAPDLPTVTVPRIGPGDPATRSALTVLASLPASVRGEVEAVDSDGPYSVTLRLAGDKEVFWGSADESARKATVLTAMLSQPGSRYDVSAPDLPTLRR
jgi:cell division protein FtsQ